MSLPFAATVPRGITPAENPVRSSVPPNLPAPDASRSLLHRDAWQVPIEGRSQSAHADRSPTWQTIGIETVATVLRCAPATALAGYFPSKPERHAVDGGGRALPRRSRCGAAPPATSPAALRRRRAGMRLPHRAPAARSSPTDVDPLSVTVERSRGDHRSSTAALLRAGDERRRLVARRHTAARCAWSCTARLRLASTASKCVKRVAFTSAGARGRRSPSARPTADGARAGPRRRRSSLGPGAQRQVVRHACAKVAGDRTGQPAPHGHVTGVAFSGWLADPSAFEASRDGGKTGIDAPPSSALISRFAWRQFAFAAHGGRHHVTSAAPPIRPATSSPASSGSRTRARAATAGRIWR